MRMALKRGRNDEKNLLGEPPPSSKRLRRSSSSSKRRLSDPTVKLLEEKVSFPNVSNCRLKRIKALTSTPSCDASASKEYRIGSYFDTQSPVYSQPFADLPKVEVGKQLDVLELLGDGNLLRFCASSPKVPSIPPTSSEGLCKGFKAGDGSRDVERIRSPVLRRCANVAGGGGAMDSTTSTTTTEFVNMESTLNLKGKYVMVCCVFVPSIWCSEDGLLVYHTALASHELARRDDFELVVVPMMREGFTHSLSAYQHFLSGFSCLAVPFQDSHRREFICSSLGFAGKLGCVVLDPSQKVLFHGPPDGFPFFGAEHDCFPLTPESEGIFSSKEYNKENRSLDELLGLSDTDVLYNIRYLAGGRLKEEDGRSITVSELKQKVVGVYMHWHGGSFKRLKEVHEECRRLKHELEIVVVCNPFRERVPPKLYDDVIIDKLASLELLGWWFFPFNNTVCYRLEQMRAFDGEEENLFIVDPSVEKCVDPYGLQIIRDFGMDSYPFTRRALIDKEFQRKKGLRLDSLLTWEAVLAGLDPEYRMDIPVAKLKDKIVVLYLYKEGKKHLADKLAAWYKRCIKRRHSNVEVVAVCIDVGRSFGAIDEEFVDMGWLVCWADPTKVASLCQEYFHPRLNPCEALVAFDEEGRIASLDPNHIFQCRGPPFHGDLREEICRQDFAKAGYRYVPH